MDRLLGAAGAPPQDPPYGAAVCRSRGLSRSESRLLRPRVIVTARDLAEAQTFPRAWEQTRRRCIALAPGGSRALKRWPEERFDLLADAIRRRGLATLRFVAPAGPPTEEDGTVRVPLRPLKALLGRCAALVTNDSGMMHLAVGLGVPVVAVFGSTVLDFGFGPLGDRDTVLERDLACRPCAPHGARFCWQGHARCLREIEVADVLTAVLERAGTEGEG